MRVKNWVEVIRAVFGLGVGSLSKKPRVCNNCGYVFNEKMSLHIHKGQCARRTYAMSSRRQRKLWRWQKNNPFGCPVCKKGNTPPRSSDHGVCPECRHLTYY